MKQKPAKKSKDDALWEAHKLLLKWGRERLRQKGEPSEKPFAQDNRGRGGECDEAE